MSLDRDDRCREVIYGFVDSSRRAGRLPRGRLLSGRLYELAAAQPLRSRPSHINRKFIRDSTVA